MQTIRVLIADDTAETRANVRRLLQLVGGFEVVDEVPDGQVAVKRALQLQPDCVLLDVNMPVMGGIAAAEQLSLHAPQIAIVMMSVLSEQEFLRQAMGAGARDYLLKPFGAEELARSIRRAVATLRRGNPEVSPTVSRLLLVAGPKGGVGRTTVATNLAVGLAMRDESTCLIDLNGQLGSAVMALGIRPHRTLAHLGGGEGCSPEALQATLQRHTSGLDILASPTLPEEAGMVTPQLVDEILSALASLYTWVIVDAPACLGALVLAVLDHQPECLLVITPDLAAARNAGQFLQTWRALGLNVSEIAVILNRVTPRSPISHEVIAGHLGLPVDMQIPEDVAAMGVAAMNGRPVVMDGRRTSSGRALQALLDRVQGIPRHTGRGSPWLTLARQMRAGLVNAYRP
jgi:pilus assembly protein CpaE